MTLTAEFFKKLAFFYGRSAHVLDSLRALRIQNQFYRSAFQRIIQFTKNGNHRVQMLHIVIKFILGNPFLNPLVPHKGRISEQNDRNFQILRA